VTLEYVNPGIDEFDAAVRAHDEALAAHGCEIWVGAEPTFTDMRSESPEWLTDALGGDKAGRAARLLERLRAAQPGAIVLRTLGRQYLGESAPRWSLGLYARRDGVAVWAGPLDPLLTATHCEAGQLRAFRSALVDTLTARGWPAVPFEIDDECPLRLVFRVDGRQPRPDPVQDPLLARSSLHEQSIEAQGITDPLAARGDFLVAFGCRALSGSDATAPCIELPHFAAVPPFLDFVACVEQAARRSSLMTLVWRGFPPPVDDSVLWTTLTPDPAVLEINQAPAVDVTAFLAANRELYALAAEEQLAPYRLQYNGSVSDSGGGGQITLGGPSPADSPFFRCPHLLARLIRYLNRHPSLSYWFAPAYVGSASQSPRPDEGVRDAFNELGVALEQLDRVAAPEPEFIWRCLHAFLVDPSGNTHRSELNVEKLWNPFLPERGCLGLVEFRALRMPRDAETGAAIAALLRAITAMLGEQDRGGGLVDWGATLHDRFALPFYLQRDLDEVLDDLQACGLGLGSPIGRHLRDDPERLIGQAEFAGCVLELQQAVEFWPLLDDVVLHHGGGSRLVDASTTRVQVSLRTDAARAGELADWRLSVAGYEVPLRNARDADGYVRLFGLRYRSFLPWRGLHPGIPAQGPLELVLWQQRSRGCLRATLHEWQPQGKPYPGVPQTLAEAARRRHERLVVEHLPDSGVPPRPAPPAALSEYCLDLRRL
jgi:uncharacterized protein (DUF2126 family)